MRKMNHIVSRGGVFRFAPLKLSAVSFGKGLYIYGEKPMSICRGCGQEYEDYFGSDGWCMGCANSND